MNKFHVEWIIFKKLMWLHQGVSAVTSWRRPLKILHFVNDVTPWINFFEIIIKYIFLNLIDFDRSEALEFILRDYFLVQMNFDWCSINFMTMNKFHVEWIIFRSYKKLKPIFDTAENIKIFFTWTSRVHQSMRNNLNHLTNIVIIKTNS